MNKYVQQHCLKPGDEIIVPKSMFDLIQHHALYIGYDAKGVHWIIHNSIGVGVRLITVDEFFKLCPKVTSIKKFTDTNADRKQLVQKSLLNIGKPYNLVLYNCEHFTSEMKTGKKTSKQIENIFLGAAAILLLSAFLGD